MLLDLQHECRAESAAPRRVVEFTRSECVRSCCFPRSFSPKHRPRRRLRPSACSDQRTTSAHDGGRRGRRLRQRHQRLGERVKIAGGPAPCSASAPKPPRRSWPWPRRDRSASRMLQSRWISKDAAGRQHDERADVRIDAYPISTSPKPGTIGCTSTRPARVACSMFCIAASSALAVAHVQSPPTSDLCAMVWRAPSPRPDMGRQAGNVLGSGSR